VTPVVLGFRRKDFGWTLTGGTQAIFQITENKEATCMAWYIACPTIWNCSYIQ